jgi:hypothetical protein
MAMFAFWRRMLRKFSTERKCSEVKESTAEIRKRPTMGKRLRKMVISSEGSL